MCVSAPEAGAVRIIRRRHEKDNMCTTCVHEDKYGEHMMKIRGTIFLVVCILDGRVPEHFRA